MYSDADLPGDPFGSAACELELSSDQPNYSSDVFLAETDYAKKAIRPEVFLIRGRRGSGKTALAAYFKFGRPIQNSTCLVITQESVFAELNDFIAANRLSTDQEFDRTKISDLCKAIMWSMIFDHVGEDMPDLKDQLPKLGWYVTVQDTNSVLHSVLRRKSSQHAIQNDIAEHFNSNEFERCRQAVLQYCKTRPIVFAFDTAEHYAVNDPKEMRVVAAFIDFAASFAQLYSRYGIYLKLFVADESFPQIHDRFSANTVKRVDLSRNAVFLSWRPKELLRVICYRYQRFLEQNRAGVFRSNEIDWSSSKDVFEKAWLPYFGPNLNSRCGNEERTLAYVLRHTQLRPRQLIVLANEIAREQRVLTRDARPTFESEAVRRGVSVAETELAVEVLNAYTKVYGDSVVSIVREGLQSTPLVHIGAELHRAAHRSASRWPKDSYSGESTYSREQFVEIVKQLGIVGIVRADESKASDHESRKYYLVDFQYFVPHELFFSEHDRLAIHPMFCELLRVHAGQGGPIVLPFPRARDSGDDELLSL